jgi:hypothetical protein
MSKPVPFDKDNSGLLIKLMPVTDKDKLIIVWQLPYVE